MSIYEIFEVQKMYYETPTMLSPFKRWIYDDIFVEREVVVNP